TSASDGSYTLTVTFNIGTDLDFAQVLVQNRVATAVASLPPGVQAQGVTVQKKLTSILMFVALTSPDNRYNALYLANYATIKHQGRAGPPAWCWQREHFWCRSIFDARVARPQ